ncbi:MAG: putative photosynthetic complex assembly protein PuhC [Hydrogenophaga sp.]|jgi:putative photosynthetic complex assembly protein|nr:putative photosynthetic complex assembly protein PuhC [Hydrogenophaga sp.]
MNTRVHPSGQRPPPAVPWPVWPLAALVLGSLLLVTWHQVEQRQAPLAQAMPVSWERSLRFVDRPNGDIAVLDASGGSEPIAVFSGEQGFLRGSLRALARERLRRGQGPEAPFLLQGHPDGRVTLSDPSSGERIHLESFGPTNVAVYSQLRTASPSAAIISRGVSP